jgi:hypothetical protein
MSDGRNFIPRRDSDFDPWFKNLCQYAALKCGGSPPDWNHIPQADLDALNASYAAWHTAYSAVLQPHSDVDIAAKTAARAEAEKVIRPFKRRFLDDPPVTDADRVAMGLHVKDHTRTPTGKITEEVDAENDSGVIRRCAWHYFIKGGTGRGKPPHAHGVECAWALLDHSPAGIGELVNRVIDTASPLILHFNEEDRGRRFYCCFRWIGTVEGHEGDWSEIFSAIIP